MARRRQQKTQPDRRSDGQSAGPIAPSAYERSDISLRDTWLGAACAIRVATHFVPG